MRLGFIIENRIKDIGMTKAEFARRIGTSRQNVNSLLLKTSYDTDLLSRISRVCKYDFYQHVDRPFKDINQATRRVLLIVEIPKDQNPDDLHHVL